MASAFQELFDELAKPFPDHEIRQRVGPSGRPLRYITARSVMTRLDEVVGAENWSDRYEFGAGNAMICTLTIRLPDGTAVSKQGIGVSSATIQEDAWKAAESDSLKRCGVKWGIGRHLYGDEEGAPTTNGTGPAVRTAVGPGAGRLSFGVPKATTPSRPGSYSALLDETAATCRCGRFDLHHYFMDQLAKENHVFESPANKLSDRFQEMARLFESPTQDHTRWFQYHTEEFRKVRGAQV